MRSLLFNRAREESVVRNLIWFIRVRCTLRLSLPVFKRLRLLASIKNKVNFSANKPSKRNRRTAISWTAEETFVRSSYSFSTASNLCNTEIVAWYTEWKTVGERVKVKLSVLPSRLSASFLRKRTKLCNVAARDSTSSVRRKSDFCVRPMEFASCKDIIKRWDTARYEISWVYQVLSSDIEESLLECFESKSCIDFDTLFEVIEVYRNLDPDFSSWPDD